MAGLKNAVNDMLDKEDLECRRHVGIETINDILINIEMRKLFNEVKILISNKNKKIIYYRDLKCIDINKRSKNKGNRCKNPAKYKRLKDCKYVCGVYSRNIKKVELSKRPKSTIYDIENVDKNIINIYFYIIRELVILIIKSFSTYFEKGLDFRLIKFELYNNLYFIYFIYNNIEYKIRIYSKNIRMFIINKYQNVQYSILFTDRTNKYQNIYELYKELNNNNISFIKFDTMIDICKIRYSKRISYQDNANILYDNLDIILFDYLSNKNF
uniref:Uncharacterized protein n=1 Tax=Pithovirus LCDPAC02 TaxID=2506601 RepID=A0A481YNJ7_9VIRU|nr:MAG: hypothetical protein LCDPAC02_01020 [Pithovirus LCDPAC02]